MTFIKNVLQLFGIGHLKFRPVPRIWCFWLIIVNAACLYFITQIEGQVVVAVTGIAVVIQAVVYGRTGFIRAFGTFHVTWITMFAWMATRMDTISQDAQLFARLVVLLATNAVSFVVDGVDFARYLRGERAPYYKWQLT